MKVGELIESLKCLPPGADVVHLWHGEAGTTIEHVWLSRDGQVVTADCDELCYRGGTRPVGAPTAKKDPYWRTPKLTRKEYEKRHGKVAGLLPVF